jgi:hypothetical protein
MEMMFSGLAGARLDRPSQNTTILSYYVTSEDLSMIVGAQMRAARAALNWSIENLAEKSGVSARTIMRLEAVDGVPPGRTQTLFNIKAALEAGGIAFTGTATDRPGIQLLRVSKGD